MIQENTIVETYTLIDDFILGIEKSSPKSLTGKAKRGFPPALSNSEVITLCLLFQMSGYKTFKGFYQYALKYLKSYFPRLVSYNRFIELKKTSSPMLFLFLNSLIQSNTCSGLSIIDSSPLAVCKNKRIQRHKTFKSLAKRGKSTMGWFFGFKAHIVISHKGELLSFTLTKGNVDDRKPVQDLCKNIAGKLFGDRGYISSKLFKSLFDTGVQLITNLKSNMKKSIYSTV